MLFICYVLAASSVSSGRAVMRPMPMESMESQLSDDVVCAESIIINDNFCEL